MHTFTTINTHLKELARCNNSTDSDEVLATTEKLIAELVALFGIPAGTLGMTQLFQNARVQSEIARFMSAPGFRRQAASYTIPHTSGTPLDLKLFWFKKASKTNLAWAMGLTPNFEDSPENFANKNISIDFVIPSSGDRLLIMLSSNYKLRVLELHQSLSHTQREIFEKWQKGAEVVDDKNALHAVLWKSFDFEPINKQFYKDLLQYFDVLTSHLERGGIDKEASKLFAVRLIGRLLFLWFVEKKGFLNSEKHYFHVSASEDQTAYYRAKLEPLFFEVLNTEKKQRTNDDIKTPFLNGGLFEAIDIDFHGDREITFPDQFFSGLYERLNHYNFTVDEGTSEYEQVAIDPEMLGRVFENLLASISDETGTQARKAKGAFYTPREIVDYMCKESLIAYLAGKLPQKNTATEERIRELVTMPESTFRDQDHNKRRDFERDIGKEDVKKALGGLRVLDPAVGSGAFPMGMLHLLVKVYSRVDPSLEKKSADLKRAILSESLYGVDIDQMAIQITRLRAWLSILVDMEDVTKVAPLPNLEFKFVCANTLIPLATDFAPLGSQIGLKETLIEIRDEYYSATRKSDKDRIRKKYLAQIFDARGLFGGIESKRQQQLKSYDPFNPLASCSFYDPNLMHGVESFDLVIGNPPYVSTEKIAEPAKSQYKDIYSDVHAPRTDLYAYFYKRGLSLSKENSGLLCYITSNKWMRAGYGEKLRAYFAQKNPLTLIDLGSGVFESATVDSNVLIVQNTSNKEVMKSTILNQTAKDNIENYFDKNHELLSGLSSSPWSILSPMEQKLELKIDSSGTVLKKYGDAKISFGIKTGLNKAFIIDENTKNSLISSDLSSVKLIKPLLSSQDIKSYTSSRPNLYIILAGFGMYKELQEKYPSIYKHLLHFKSELQKRGQCIGSRSGKTMSPDFSGQHHWLELDNNPSADFFKEFEKDKIVWRQITTKPTFCIATAGTYIYAPSTFLTVSSNIEYVLGILNSKLVLWYYSQFAHNVGGIGNGARIEWKKVNIEKIPIPEISIKNNDIAADIKSIVLKITAIKNQDPKANTQPLETQIDHLIYQLYNLTPEEIEIIEGK